MPRPSKGLGGTHWKKRRNQLAKKVHGPARTYALNMRVQKRKKKVEGIGKVGEKKKKKVMGKRR